MSLAVLKMAISLSEYMTKVRSHLYTLTDLQLLKMVFDGLSRTGWRKRYQHLNGDQEWLDDEDTLQNVVNHVLGGWKGYWSNSLPGPGPEPSEWISTTSDLEWAVWEIARRLTVLQRKTVSMTLIDRNEHYLPAWRGIRQIYLETARYLNRFNHNDHYSEERRLKAYNFAKGASEVLVHGRIFDRDVLESRRWSVHSTGFTIPAWFSIPRSHRVNGYSVSWLDRLAWDPRGDSFSTAKRKMQERYQQIYGYGTGSRQSSNNGSNSDSYEHSYSYSYPNDSDGSDDSYYW